MIGEESSPGVVDPSRSDVATVDSGFDRSFHFRISLSSIQRFIACVKVLYPVLFGYLASKLEDIVSIVIAETH